MQALELIREPDPRGHSSHMTALYVFESDPGMHGRQRPSCRYSPGRQRTACTDLPGRQHPSRIYSPGRQCPSFTLFPGPHRPSFMGLPAWQCPSCIYSPGRQTTVPWVLVQKRMGTQMSNQRRTVFRVAVSNVRCSCADIQRRLSCMLRENYTCNT